MSDRQKITLFVNEEGVAKETVMVTARGWGLVELINDGADSGGERGVVSKVIGRGTGRQAAEKTDKKGCRPGSGTRFVLAHWSEEPFRGLSGTTANKVAARREVGKARKRTGKKGLTGSGNNCIFCNNRNNRHDESNKKDARLGRAKMREPTKNNLTPVAQKFILHWGEMGTRWGINRTVAQVHALLFLSPQPLPADEISATLAVARSNVSTSLRELQGWRIVRVVHALGDRRDHFESIKDVWEIFRIVSEERKRREIDPTLNVLAECVREVKSNPQGDAYTRERLESMLEFLTAMTGLFEEIIRMPTGALKGVVKLRGKVITLLGKKAVNS